MVTNMVDCLVAGYASILVARDVHDRVVVYSVFTIGCSEITNC